MALDAAGDTANRRCNSRLQAEVAPAKTIDALASRDLCLHGQANPA